MYDFNINDLPEIYLKKAWLTDDSDFDELNKIEDTVLCLCGVFNNVKLSKCSRNHCLNCPEFPQFNKFYHQVSRYFLHTNYIIEEAKQFILDEFKNENFIGMHLRTSDTIGKKTFFEIYIGCSEEDIYNSLCYYANKFYIDKSNIFIACPPAALKVKTIRLLNTSFFKKYQNKNKYEPYIVSLIEQEICNLSTIFVRSITNTPHIPKNHTRSSWGTGVDDYRKCYQSTINDISINILIDEYKQNDRKSYINWDNLTNDKPNLSLMIEEKPKVEPKTEVREILNLPKLTLLDFYNDKTTYSLKDSLGKPLDHKLKEFLSTPNGFYIEVGSNDGVKQSNTKIFEDLFGWKGILIEPSHKSYIECIKNRPNSIVENYAMVSNDYIGEYIEGDFDGHLMSSVTSKRLKRKSKITKCKVSTLDKILDNNNVKRIDFLCIDVEGYESEVIKSITLDKYIPKYIMIQIMKKDNNTIIEYMGKNKYRMVLNISNYNKKDNPKWNGEHNDYLFEYQY